MQTKPFIILVVLGRSM